MQHKTAGQHTIGHEHELAEESPAPLGTIVLQFLAARHAYHHIAVSHGTIARTGAVGLQHPAVHYERAQILSLGSEICAAGAKHKAGIGSVGWRQHNLGFKVVYFVKGHGHTQYRVAGHLYPAFYRFGCRCPLKFFQIL